MNDTTEHDKKRKVLTKIIKDLTQDNIDMYYNSTSDTSNLIKDYIDKKKNLSKDELELVQDMSARDISILLSINS